MDEHPHTARVWGSGTKPGVPGARFASPAGSACVAQACRGGGHAWPRETHVDLVLLVADQEVVHHACLVQVPQADHVIHTLS